MAYKQQIIVSEGAIIPFDSGELWKWAQGKEGETVYITIETEAEHNTKRRMDTFHGVVRDLYNIYVGAGVNVSFEQIKQRVKENTGLAEWTGFPMKDGTVEEGWVYESSKMSIKRFSKWLEDVELWWMENVQQGQRPNTLNKLYSKTRIEE